MDSKKVPDSELNPKPEELTPDEAARFTLEQLEALAAPGHPMAPVARRLLDQYEERIDGGGDPWEIVEWLQEAFHRVLDLWPDSTVGAVQDFHVNPHPGPRGRRILTWYLAGKYPHPLHSGRRKELLARGEDPDALLARIVDPGRLIVEAAGGQDAPLFAALYLLAALRARERLLEDAVANLPESLESDAAFRNELTEEAAAMIAGTRSRARKPEPVEPAELDRRPEVRGTTRRDVAELLTAAEEERIRRLAHLTPSEERIWTLTYYDELTPTEIAEREGRSPGAVRVHLSNARKKLQEAHRKIAG